MLVSDVRVHVHFSTAHGRCRPWRELARGLHGAPSHACARYTPPGRGTTTHRQVSWLARGHGPLPAFPASRPVACGQGAIRAQLRGQLRFCGPDSLLARSRGHRWRRGLGSGTCTLGQDGRERRTPPSRCASHLPICPCGKNGEGRTCALSIFAKHKWRGGLPSGRSEGLFLAIAHDGCGNLLG